MYKTIVQNYENTILEGISLRIRSILTWTTLISGE